MIAIVKGAKVFDGVKLLENATVAIENGIIVDQTEGDMVIDGSGCTLLPGLIDSHIHLYDVENLQATVRCGVTTVLDMGSRSHAIVDELKNRKDVSGLLSSHSPAFAPNSGMAQKMNFPDSSIVKNVADSFRFVNEQIGASADYIKVIIEDEGKNGGVDFPPDILKTIVDAAHKNGKRVVAHVVSPQSFEIAANCGVDVLTHIPFMADLPQETIDLTTNFSRLPRHKFAT
jgi:imidazolonepropionase-like amidohydrolase